MKNIKIFLVFLSVSVTFLFSGLFFINEKIEDSEFIEELVDENEIIRSSPSIQMYFYIKKYSKKFGVPEEFAFAIAYHETRYQGPLHFEYDHKKVSSAGAVGPMQIIPRYAHKYAGRVITAEELKNDIELNVRISMQMLKKWHKKFGDWAMAAGAYNTGKPIINAYARSVSNLEYKWKKTEGDIYLNYE